jgi:hypothetical protein
MEPTTINHSDPWVLVWMPQAMFYGAVVWRQMLEKHIPAGKAR